MSAKAYLYDGTKKLRLKEAATDASAFKAQKAELKERTEENLRKAAVLQEKLYAAGQEGLVFAIQAREGQPRQARFFRAEPAGLGGSRVQGSQQHRAEPRLSVAH